MPDLYGGSVVKPYLGRVVMKKLAGSGPIAVGTQVVIPHASVFPRNPKNNSYLTGVNSAGAVSGDVPGKKTPSLTLTSVVRATSFFTANFVNSLILATDSNGDSDTWGIYLDDKYLPLTYDGSKCAALRVQQISQGGAIALSMAFLSMYGDSENPGTIFVPTTFTSTAIDNGAATDITKVSYGGTADLVAAIDLNYVRPQGYVYYDDATLFPAGIASGIFTGSAEITQSLKYAASWNTSGTINLGATGAGVSLAHLVKLDEDMRDMTIANRYVKRALSLYDSASGGMPVTATAM
jgi:hypothetical protein